MPPKVASVIVAKRWCCSEWLSEAVADVTISEKRWSEIKRLLPVGSRVSGTVAARHPFGFFVSIRGFRDLAALIEITTFADEAKRSVEINDFPPLGSSVKAEVLYYADGAQQARLGHVEVE